MAAFHYEFSIAGYHKVDAQTVGEMLEDMSAKGIEVTPEAVLEASRNENSPTHCEFEWDDTVAAEKYRLEQARNLIIHIRIVREEQEQNEYKPRGFVSIPGGRAAYVPLETALGKDEYRDHLLKQAKNDTEIYLAKYRKLEELAGVTQAMTEFLKNVG